MPFLFRCPFCSTTLEYSAVVEKGVCPGCLKDLPTYQLGVRSSIVPPGSSSSNIPHPSEQSTSELTSGAPQSRKTTRHEADDEESTFPPLGLAGLVLGAIAWASAPLGIWLFTILFSALGVLVIAFGVTLQLLAWRKHDVVWHLLGGILSGAVLLLGLLAPSFLNPFWAMDFTLPQPDPHKQVVVRRDWPLEPGKPLTSDDWVDGINDAIRQDRVQIRIEALTGPEPGRSTFLVHFRLGNSGHVEKIICEGFDNQKHKPVLTDASGRSFAFLEQKFRKFGVGLTPVFEEMPPGVVEVPPISRKEYLLIFQAPSSEWTGGRWKLDWR